MIFTFAKRIAVFSFSQKQKYCNNEAKGHNSSCLCIKDLNGFYFSLRTTWIGQRREAQA
jgi:hypothetical protein